MLQYILSAFYIFSVTVLLNFFFFLYGVCFGLFWLKGRLKNILKISKMH